MILTVLHMFIVLCLLGFSCVVVGFFFEGGGGGFVYKKKNQ